MELRIRFAPTPSGYLHVGNALNAILIKVWAVQHHASLLLRIDDLDALRSRAEYVEDIFETLHWLSIDWDEGPRNATEFHQQWSQQLRLIRYREFIDYLLQKHQLYACRCSRSRSKALSSSECTCLESSFTNPPYHLRLTHTPDKVHLQDEWGNTFDLVMDRISPLNILQKADLYPSYQLASLIDDLDYKVSHVIRGDDLLESSAFQSLLYTLLPQVSPLPRWMHHPLILKQDKKISKSNGDISIRHLRSIDKKPEQIYAWVGRMLGFPSATSLADLCAVLDLSQKPRLHFNYWE